MTKRKTTTKRGDVIRFVGDAPPTGPMLPIGTVIELHLIVIEPKTGAHMKVGGRYIICDPCNAGGLMGLLEDQLPEAAQKACDNYAAMMAEAMKGVEPEGSA